MAFYYTKGASKIATATGAISSISSIIYIFIILRSKLLFRHKLPSPYQLLLLICAIADFITSIAIAWAPIPDSTPFPFEGKHDEDQDTSYYEDGALFTSSSVSCHRQGMLFTIGNLLILNTNSCIHIVFYLMTLFFKLPNLCTRLTTYGITLFSLLFSITYTIKFYKSEIREGPGDPFCAPNASYQIQFQDCDSSLMECKRSLVGYGSLFNYTLLVSFLILIGTMTAVVVKFSWNVQKVRKEQNTSTKDGSNVERSNRVVEYSDTESTNTDNDLEQELLLHVKEQSKRINWQAFMHTFIFSLTWMFWFIEYLSDLNVYNLEGNAATAVAILRLLFQPLQGFMRLILFVTQNVMNLKRSDESMTISEALIIIFFKSSILERDEAVIGNMSLMIEYDLRKAMLNLHSDHLSMRTWLPAEFRESDENEEENIQDQKISIMSGSLDVLERTSMVSAGVARSTLDNFSGIENFSAGLNGSNSGLRLSQESDLGDSSGQLRLNSGHLRARSQEDILQDIGDTLKNQALDVYDEENNNSSKNLTSLRNREPELNLDKTKTSLTRLSTS